MILAPCKGCEERNARCHAECERYKEKLHKEELGKIKADEAAHNYSARHMNSNRYIKSCRKRKNPHV